MKILVLSSGFLFDHGGGRKVIEWMFSSFNQTDQLIVCSFEIGSDGPENKRLPSGMIKGENLFIIKGSNGKEIIWQYCQFLRSHKPDIIFDISALNIKVITLSCSFSLGFRKKHIFCEHSPIRSVLPLIKNRLMSKLIPYAFRYASYVMTVSESQMKYMADLFQLKDQRYECIYNPVDRSHIVLQADDELILKDIAATALLVVTVCRLDPGSKDVGTLIKAFAKVVMASPTAVLVVAGVGPGREQWEVLAESLGVESQVKFSGYLDNPMPLIKRADVYVQSSLYESFGLAIVEAMACGTPVVATDCDFGPAEILGDGMYGQLVEVGNVKQMAEVILQVLEKPENYVDSAKLIAKRVEDFSPHNSFDLYKNLFERIASENSY
jgi:glycosyltransferase involved in cell wall biosynthesis